MAAQNDEQKIPALDDCLKLLQGERDEQRLAGLLLVTKCCNNDDHDSIFKVYNAIGVRFLDRLLRTGMAKENVAGRETDDREAYLHLGITILAAFCRVPAIAASADMTSNIPLVLEVMEKESASSFLEDCYEILLITALKSESAVATLFESGGLRLLATQLPSLPDGSQVLELSLRLFQLIISKISLDAIVSRHLSELSTMVVSIARQFGILQNALKFDLLQLIGVIFSSDHSVALKDALRAMSNNNWSTYMRAGVMDILQNRVAPEQKIQALIVAEAMLSLLGEGWLIGQLDVPDLHKSFPSDRCWLLVLESSRVEIAVLLNELAYFRHAVGTSKSEAFPLKNRNLAIAFSLVENVIKLISNHSEDEGSIFSQGTVTKIICGINETVEVVLEYLKEAKDTGQRKGNDLLASIRLVGSYLAEAPLASGTLVKELLEYMLSVEGEDESRPFLCRCFLLPMLCQRTMSIKEVQFLASSGAYKAVMECLVQLVSKEPDIVQDNETVLLACDTVLNFLLKEHIEVQLDESVFLHVLKALAYWTARTSDSTVIMMASSICSLIFDNTSQKALLRCPEIDIGTISRLSLLIARSLTIGTQKTYHNANSDEDLHQIIAAGFSRWANRFPAVRDVVV
ncbi:uncharacterized protein LOC104889192 isoform X2 [Beta vulgaris subsp. vulgaris]|uniref:uncharacterized protein LOC104889192 isoform X2 n=1 Tax=Beta vulgaris subsp. vulgaris TaxID=3555 RepID=UPI002036EDBF|nr:uncharacterized protein LOC104889192 isoform X2 [Beta vulgaris subsp. vulgaris]